MARVKKFYRGRGKGEEGRFKCTVFSVLYILSDLICPTYGDGRNAKSKLEYWTSLMTCLPNS